MNQEIKKIESEIIEKHSVIVGRIYVLKEEYRKKLRIFENLGQTEAQVVLTKVIQDLEELTK